MIQLVPMSEDQYEAFMVISARDQMEGHVREGRWHAKEAEANPYFVLFRKDVRLKRKYKQVNR